MRQRIMGGAAAAILTATGFGAVATAAAVADRIRYDAHCLTINDVDTLVYSGAFHYFRCPKPLWAARLQSMKSAGLNAVETYVPWDWHERTRPANVDDFSKIDLADLHDFLDLAINQFGFNVMIRPGPYICAEWDGGGYPQWLRLQKPAGYKGQWARGDDPTYLAWCKHWFSAVASVAAPFQITHQPEGKPGIILWQIENEYDYDVHTAEVKLHQLQALAHDSRDAGIDVPLFTCMTDNPLYRADPYLLGNVIDTRNAYPGFDADGFVHGIDELRPYQPDKPLMMTELQGGWFSNVGGALSQAKGFNAAQITQLTMLAWAHGFTSTNYYMMFGGTNLGDWAAAGITTTYDYAAPIRECGGVDERYQAVSSMAHMIRQMGPKLVRAELEPSHVDAPAGVSTIVRKAPDGSRFIFVFNGSKSDPKQGTLKLTLADAPAAPLSINFDLKPFDAKLLALPANETDSSKGDWLPKLQPLPQRPATLPEAIQITTIKEKTDPGPVDWKPVTGDRSEESNGIFDRRFVYYRARVPGTSFAHPAVWCRTEISGRMLASLDGSPLTSTESMGGVTVFGLPTNSGPHEFTALYENAGRPNGGAAMEAPGGIVDLSVVDADTLGRSIGTWRMKRLDANDDGSADVGATADDSRWRKFTPKSAEELKTGQSAVYRCAVDVSDADLSAGRTVLRIGRIDDRGTVYVNGHKAGESTDWNTPIKLNLRPQLHAGANVIAVIVHNGDGPGGLGLGISLDTPGTEGATPATAPYEIGAQSTGDAQRWFADDFDDHEWAPASAASGDGSHATLLDWYRLHVTIPEAPAHAWVPLKLRLESMGDGFLYLNGHPLGRWWQQGPQKDFFLPDCWLKRGRDNVITLSLQHTVGNTVSASVLPYEDLAEVRP